MKERGFIIALSAGVLTLSLAVGAFAQLPGAPLRANIPFDFMVRGKTLPAGEYEFRRINDQADGLEVLNIHQNHEHTLFNTEPVDKGNIARHGEIVFHRYGDTYFLYEVWTAGLETGRELPISKQERYLRSETASNAVRPQPETVAIAVY